MHQLLQFVRAGLRNIFGEPFCSFSRRLFVDIDVAREGDELSVAGDLSNSPRLIPVSSAVMTSGLRCARRLEQAASKRASSSSVNTRSRCLSLAFEISDAPFLKGLFATQSLCSAKLKIVRSISSSRLTAVMLRCLEDCLRRCIGRLRFDVCRAPF
jgi:hypothetical protein